MRARIVKEFHDKSDYRKVYRVDDLVDFSDSRFAELYARGLVEAVKVTPTVEEVVSEEKQERKRRVRKND